MKLHDMAKPQRSLARYAGLTVIAVAMVGSTAPTTQPASDVALTRLVDSFTQAQRDCDPATLARLTTTDYVEVSPIGDVDTREKMLGFYAPEKKRPAPTLTISERLISQDGNDAVILAKLSFASPGPGGVTRSMAMRASFVARRLGRDWRLAAVQYTPIRSQGS